MSKSKHVKTILIDLDGTLRDTRNLIYEAYQHAIRTHSGKEVAVDEIKPHVHHHTVVHKAFADHVEHVEFEKTYMEFVDLTIDNVNLYDGTEQLLDSLKKSGYKVAIVTSAPQHRAEDFIKKVGLYDNCDLVVGVTPGRRPKPAPDMLIEAMKQLKSGPKNTIMIGDMTVDVEAAHAAGVQCIGITHGFATREELKQAGVDYLVDSLAELSEYLDG